jgi:enhanced filamentous growth protein 1
VIKPPDEIYSVRNFSYDMADNHMINGTKLLNVAGMTRGRRDGILKSEKMRHVVKIGPMHLKGVWYVIHVLMI